jgi:MFS family permease
MVRSYHLQFSKISQNVKIFLLGNAIQGMGLSIYGLLFNLYLKELGFGESAIGGLISTTSLGISLMALPAAFIIEKFHVKHLVVTSLFFTSVFYFLQILNVDENSLFTFGLFASMCQALFNISVAPFYLRNSTPDQRVHLFTMNSSLNMFAHFLGYLLGGYLPELIHNLNPELLKVELYRLSLIISLGIVCCSNLMFLKIKRVPIPKVRKKIFQGLKDKQWRILGKLIIPKLFFAFGGGLIVPFMNLYLKEKFTFSTELIGLSYAFLQFLIFLGIFVTPSIISKTTQLRFIVMTGLFSIPFMIAMGFTGNVGLVLSCFFMRGVLMNMSGPITSIFEMERVREDECVFASATILFFYHMVYTTSTRFGGFLIENFSFGETFYVAGCFYALAITFYYSFFKKEDEDLTLKFEA